MMNFLDELRIEPKPTETIQIRIVATVTKRVSHQTAIENIHDCVKEQYPELKINHMNSPLLVTIEIKE